MASNCTAAASTRLRGCNGGCGGRTVGAISGATDQRRRPSVQRLLGVAIVYASAQVPSGPLDSISLEEDNAS
jgi:hypothetical protein